MTFSQFIRERKYLSNVSPATVEWYTHAFKWLPSDSPTPDQLKDTVMRMREKGLRATGANSAIRAINAYLHWTANPNIKCSPACTHSRISYLKEEEKILPTFTIPQVKLLTRWTPDKSSFQEIRLHALVLTLFDTGCRMDEPLSSQIADFDFDNLLLTIMGKGRKQRIVPFSVELRRVLVRYMRFAGLDNPQRRDVLMFPTSDGGKQDRRNVLRDVKILCRRLGFEPPERTVHAMRHTFSVEYLRRGGSLFHLQKCLGHADLETTRRYVNLVVDDLSAMHPRVSLLSNFR